MDISEVKGGGGGVVKADIFWLGRLLFDEIDVDVDNNACKLPGNNVDKPSMIFHSC